MNTETQNIRLVTKTAVTISFTIGLDGPKRFCGKSPELPQSDPAILPQVYGSDIWQKRNRPGLLDRSGEGALVLGATSRQSPGSDFAAFGDKISQGLRVFVTNYKT